MSSFFTCCIYCSTMPLSFDPALLANFPGQSMRLLVLMTLSLVF
ncbi:hypothetical protein DSUL_20217 [Desulfovibrionales bacterium]